MIAIPDRGSARRLMTPSLRHRTRAVTPVFVDGSGRRLRRVRIALIVAGALAAAYTVLIIVSLLGVPTVASPFLAQPRHPAASTPTPSPSVTRPAASHEPAHDGSGSETQNDGIAPVTVADTSRPSPTATTAPATAATPAPAATPTPSPTSGKSASAPGQTKTHPTAKPTAHPTAPSKP